MSFKTKTSAIHLISLKRTKSMAVWAAEMGFLNQVESTEIDPVDVIRRLKGINLYSNLS